MSQFCRPALALIAVTYFGPGLLAEECGEDPAHYNGYLVQHVEIRTPIAFFAAATFGFDELKARLPLQEGRPFSAHEFSAGTAVIRDEIRATGSGGSEMLKI